MHEYYRNNILKLKKENEGYLRFVKVELEQNAGKPYSEVWEEIWGFYEKNLLEHFPYIGGDKVSGTKNLTGAYIFVAMGEVLKRYGVSVEGSARLMVLAYERSYEEDIFLAQACHEDVSKERPGEYGERCKISRQL